MKQLPYTKFKTRQKLISSVRVQANEFFSVRRGTSERCGAVDMFYILTSVVDTQVYLYVTLFQGLYLYTSHLNKEVN